AENALEQLLVPRVARHLRDVAPPPGRDRCWGYVVAHEDHHVGASVTQHPREMTSEEAGGAGDEHGPVPPPATPAHHTLQGASPESHSSVSSSCSRGVSIGCQKPSCS